MAVKIGVMSKVKMRPLFLFLFILICFFLTTLPALAATGDVEIGPPSSDPLPTSSFTVPVTVDSGSNPLGAYDFTITYDPSVVIIESISGGSTPEFSSAPVTNPATFTTGSTDFNAVNITSLNSPTGVVEVANITFKVVGQPGQCSDLSITVNGLVDTNGIDIPPNPINGSVCIAKTNNGFNIWLLFFSGLMMTTSGYLLLRRRKLIPFFMTFVSKTLKAITLILKTTAQALILSYSLIQRYKEKAKTVPVKRMAAELIYTLPKPMGIKQMLNKHIGTVFSHTVFLTVLAVSGLTIINTSNTLLVNHISTWLVFPALLAITMGFFLLKQRKLANLILLVTSVTAGLTILKVTLYASLLTNPKTAWPVTLALFTTATGFFLLKQRKLANTVFLVTLITAGSALLGSSIHIDYNPTWLVILALLAIATGVFLLKPPTTNPLIILKKKDIFKKATALLLVFSLFAPLLTYSPKQTIIFFYVLLTVSLIAFSFWLLKKEEIINIGKNVITLFLLVPIVLAILVFALFTQPALAVSTFGDADANGIFDQNDYRYIQRYLVGLESIPPLIENSDVNADSEVNIKDALILSQVAHTLRSSFSNMVKVNRQTVYPPDAFGKVRIVGSDGAAPPNTVVTTINLRTGYTATTPTTPTGSFDTGATIPAVQNDPLKEYVTDSSGILGPPITKTVPTQKIFDPPPGTTPSPNPGTTQETNNPVCGQCTDEKEGQSHVPDAGDPNDYGHPIYLHSGEFFEMVTDLRIPGRGFDFEFTRKYKSQITYDGPLGHNWDFNYNKSIARSGANINVFNGYARRDIYTSDGAGGFNSPPEFFTKLTENFSGSFTLRERDGTRYLFYPFDWSGRQGKLAAIVDRNKNTMRFFYDIDGKLTSVLDTFGREINFFYNASGKITKIRDFAGREVTYSYDGNGDLVAVTSPKVTGTPNGNDFLNGKTTKYTYSSGNPNPLLNHNLLTITNPNETALDPDGPPVVQNTYDSNDRVISQAWGDPPNSGGTLNFAYTSLPGVPGDPNSAISRTGVTDRAGNYTEYSYNSSASTLQVKEFTNRGVRPGEGDYTTSYQYNSDGMVTKVTLPEGNSIEYTYDSLSPSRFSQRNLLQEKKLPGPRGGDQTSITTIYTYEPVYNQIKTTTDPRGNDPTFVPPLGSQSAARYTATHTYDYQEGNNLIAIADELGMTTAQASALLTSSGVSLGLGDVNGDGLTSQRSGNLIRMQEPTVLLPPSSSLIPIEGDNTQEIITDYQYNQFGQQTSEIDPEGNVTEFHYYPALDPDGDGVPISLPHILPVPYRPPRFADTGGYLKETIEDSKIHPRRRETASPAQVSNKFTYDVVGNRTKKTDGNGNTITYIYNQLNQVVRTIAPAPFFYRTDVFYDANDNQTRVDVQNVTTNALGANEVVSANSSLTTLYTYDILDNRLSETREVSAGEVGPAETVTTNYRYDANENQIRVIQPEGNETVYVYDERDLLYSTTGGTCASGCTSLPLADRPTTTVNYDGNENRTSATDAQDNNGDGVGETTLYTHDGYDRLIQTKDAAGGIGDTLYDPAGNVLRTRGYGQPSGPTPVNNSGIGNVLLSQKESRYDELNRRYETRDILFNTPGGSISPDSPLVTKYEYDRGDRQVRVVDPKGHATGFTYDGLDRMLTTADALGNTATYTYDKNSNRTRVVETDEGGTLPDESFTAGYQYDSLNRLIRTTDNLGNTRRFFYDSRGNQVWTSDANGPAMVDPSGEFPYATTPSGVTIINGHGNTTKHTYDGLNRLVRTEQHQRLGGDGNGSLNPAGDLDLSNPENTDGIITTTRDYDGNSRLVSEADDEGKATTYTHDALDRLSTKTNPDSTNESYQYDRDSHQTVRTDENGTTVNDTYDALDRRTGEAATLAGLPSAGGTTAQSFQYDGLGRMTRSTDNNDTGTGDDSTVVFGYDSANRLLGESQTIGALPARTVSSVYDKASNRTSLTYPNGRVTSSEYDNLDRLDIINNGANTTDPDIVNYDYLGPGRVAKRTYFNGTKLTMLNDTDTADIGYDGLRRLVKQRHLTSGNSVIAGHDYAYDREDNKRYEKRLQGDATADIFGYDSIYQLKSTARNATDPSNPGTAAFTDSYLYDGVGNRINSTEDSASKTYTHDAKNQYTTVSGTGYTLDSKGNIANDGSYKYKYDYKDRLVEVRNSSDNSLVAGYKYDAFNRRISKETTTTTFFYWDGWQLVEERNVPTDAVVAQYTYGNGIDEPLTMERSGQTYYYHQNELGNVIAITNAVGAVVEGYRYPAYGKPTVLTGAGVDGVWFTGDDVTSATSAIGNRYMFTGREYDEETGLYYYRNRYYNPMIGRFLTRDPLGGVEGLNLYEYVRGNPQTYIDPLGLQVLTPPQEADSPIIYQARRKRDTNIDNLQQLTRKEGETEEACVARATKYAKVATKMAQLVFQGELTEWQLLAANEQVRQMEELFWEELLTAAILFGAFKVATIPFSAAKAVKFAIVAKEIERGIHKLELGIEVLKALKIQLEIRDIQSDMPFHDLYRGVFLEYITKLEAIKEAEFKIKERCCSGASAEGQAKSGSTGKDLYPQTPIQGLEPNQPMQDPYWDKLKEMKGPKPIRPIEELLKEMK